MCFEYREDVINMPWVKKEECIKCKICVNVCPVEGAIRLESDGYPYIDIHLHEMWYLHGKVPKKCNKAKL